MTMEKLHDFFVNYQSRICQINAQNNLIMNDYTILYSTNFITEMRCGDSKRVEGAKPLQCGDRL